MPKDTLKLLEIKLELEEDVNDHVANQINLVGFKIPSQTCIISESFLRN